MKLKNLDTFCVRYELCQQKAYTLLQAEQAKVPGIKRLRIHDGCISVINSSNSLKMIAIHDCVQYAIMSAEALKTDNGKLNRYTKLLSALLEKEHIFSGTPGYIEACKDIETRIINLGGTPISQNYDTADFS